MKEFKIREKFLILEKKLGLNFNQKELLIEAFCHRSFLNENPSFKYPHNERLEFLGDAVLELIISEELFKRFPEKTEGELTLMRSNLVCQELLSQVAKNLDFENFLLLSKGEQKEKGKKKILANAFEALIGAIYLDKGMKEAKSFVLKHLSPFLEKILKEGPFKDPKTHLQEIVQEKLKITPTYQVLKEWGPDHKKNFLVGVFFGEKLIATGEGGSKKEAEEEAAKEALQKINLEFDNFF